jgi:hypothetical protein
VPRQSIDLSHNHVTTLTLRTASNNHSTAVDLRAVRPYHVSGIDLPDDDQPIRNFKKLWALVEAFCGGFAELLAPENSVGALYGEPGVDVRVLYGWELSSRQ